MSATVARPVLAHNRRSLEIQRDNSLDQVSYLQDARRRATDYLKCLAADVEPITVFDINEALAILNETREASDARRFPAVLDSEPLNQKEDQQ